MRPYKQPTNSHAHRSCHTPTENRTGVLDTFHFSLRKKHISLIILSTFHFYISPFPCAHKRILLLPPWTFSQLPERLQTSSPRTHLDQWQTRPSPRTGLTPPTKTASTWNRRGSNTKTLSGHGSHSKLAVKRSSCQVANQLCASSFLIRTAPTLPLTQTSCVDSLKFQFTIQGTLATCSLR